MDRESLEHSLVRRLLEHVANRTTDLAAQVLELPTSAYSEQRQAEELRVLFLGRPPRAACCPTASLIRPADSR